MFFLTTYQQKASPVRSLQFLELFERKKVSKSVIAEQHPRLMQNNADRPKIRVHHKRKFREITSLQQYQYIIWRKVYSFSGEFTK